MHVLVSSHLDLKPGLECQLSPPPPWWEAPSSVLLWARWFATSPHRTWPGWTIHLPAKNKHSKHHWFPWFPGFERVPVQSHWGKNDKCSTPAVIPSSRWFKRIPILDDDNPKYCILIYTNTIIASTLPPQYSIYNQPIIMCQLYIPTCLMVEPCQILWNSYGYMKWWIHIRSLYFDSYPMLPLEMVMNPIEIHLNPTSYATCPRPRHVPPHSEVVVSWAQ